MRRLAFVLPVVSALVIHFAGHTPAQPPFRPFEPVGRDPLFNRGMNAGLAIAGSYAYVGNRTDASQGRENSGVLIVTIEDPARPRVVGEIGSPDQDDPGLSSRELRAWPQGSLLIVMNVTCEVDLHRCARATAPPVINFFDIGAEAASSPRLASSYRPRIEPHEMFLWVDPASSQRALLYLSTNAASANLPDLLVIDISRAQEGVFREVATWNAPSALGAGSGRAYPARLHSISVSPDGRVGYAAFWGGGFQILDISDVAEGKTDPSIRLVTRDGGLRWGGPAHSAIPVPGRSLVLLSDEVQGSCPWGWVRIADVSNDGRPSLAGEFRVEQNRSAGCAELRARRLANHSHTAHNPTVLSNLALITWHSAGLRAIDLQNSRRPQSAGSFVPESLETVATEDPDLTGGVRGVAMWSYPIIKDGLVHVVDVRNGLYVLKYQGRWAEEVGAVRFAEGNSNVGADPQVERTSPSPHETSASISQSPANVQPVERPRNNWWPLAAIAVGGLVMVAAIVALLAMKRS